MHLRPAGHSPSRQGLPWSLRRAPAPSSPPVLYQTHTPSTQPHAALPWGHRRTSHVVMIPSRALQISPEQPPTRHSGSP